MITAAALAFAQLPSVEVGPRSALVAPDHLHFWQIVVQDDETMAWHDATWSGTHQQDEITYPVLLFRAIPRNEDTVDYIDLKLAFDCSGQRIGIVDSALHTKPDGEIQRSEIATVTFDFAKDPPGDDDVILLGIACGAKDKD